MKAIEVVHLLILEVLCPLGCIPQGPEEVCADNSLMNNHGIKKGVFIINIAVSIKIG